MEGDPIDYIPPQIGEMIYMYPVEATKIKNILPIRGLICRYQDQKRPWSPTRDERDENLAISKRNYKLYADFGVWKTYKSLNISVLYTVAGLNFIHDSQLPEKLVTRNIGIDPNINNADGHLLKNKLN